MSGRYLSPRRSQPGPPTSAADLFSTPSSKLPNTKNQTRLIPFHEALIESSIHILRHYEPKDAPYHGCFSGGKDSCAIKQLAKIAGVHVEWHYNVTTIDPPELVIFIRRNHPDVLFDKPKESFAKAILRRGVPCHRTRWCCELFKEKQTPRGRRIILGVRAAESQRRAKIWRTFTYHKQTHEYAVLPIFHWKTENVWQFIHDNQLPYCQLYDEGWKRIGCIGCPMTSTKNRYRDYARWPAIARQIKKAARTRWEQQKAKGVNTRSYNAFETFDDFWTWWLSMDPLPQPNQTCHGQSDLYT